MKINFSNSSLKFLEKINEKDKERIRFKIKEMITEIETIGIIPFAKLNVKRLEGNSAHVGACLALAGCPSTNVQQC